MKTKIYTLILTILIGLSGFSTDTTEVCERFTMMMAMSANAERNALEPASDTIYMANEFVFNYAGKRSITVVNENGNERVFYPTSGEEKISTSMGTVGRIRAVQSDGSVVIIAIYSDAIVVYYEELMGGFVFFR